jgi:hypothetical protein
MCQCTLHCILPNPIHQPTTSPLVFSLPSVWSLSFCDPAGSTSRMQTVWKLSTPGLETPTSAFWPSLPSRTSTQSASASLARSAGASGRSSMQQWASLCAAASWSLCHTATACLSRSEVVSPFAATFCMHCDGFGGGGARAASLQQAAKLCWLCFGVAHWFFELWT